MANVQFMAEEFKRDIPPGVEVIQIPDCCPDARRGAVRWAGGVWMSEMGMEFRYCPWCGEPLTSESFRREVFFKRFSPQDIADG